MAGSATVGQRFMQLIAHLGISKNAFAASIGKTATVIQHLVDERNKPGFDLLCAVFEVYPNVSKDWMLQGVGPMLTDQNANNPVSPVVAPAAASKPQPVAVEEAAEETTEAAPPIKAPAAPRPAALASTPTPAVTSAAPKEAAPVVAPETPAAAPASVPVAAPPAAAAAALASVTPIAAPPVAADTSWQTALYTQQMAHQLALAELRNQHLQDQQRLMQQMLDMMQRQLPR